MLKAAQNGTKTLKKKDKQARHVHERCIDSFQDFITYSWMKHLFRSAFSGQLIHCCEISGNKNYLRLKSPKNSPASAES